MASQDLQELYWRGTIQNLSWVTNNMFSVSYPVGWQVSGIELVLGGKTWEAVSSTHGNGLSSTNVLTLAEMAGAKCGIFPCSAKRWAWVCLYPIPTPNFDLGIGIGGSIGSGGQPPWGRQRQLQRWGRS